MVPNQSFLKVNKELPMELNQKQKEMIEIMDSVNAKRITIKHGLLEIKAKSNVPPKSI